MILVLALGGILIADFTLWGFSLQSAYLDESAAAPRTGWLAKCLGSGSQQVENDDEEEADGDDDRTRPTSRRRELSTLLTTLLSALSCASAVALFAPHKTNFTAHHSLKSYPARDYTQNLGSFIQSDDITKALSAYLVDSAAVTRDAAIKSIAAVGNQPYVREARWDQTERPRTYRIGDTTYEGLRTQGVGVNMASFNDYFLSSRDKLVSLGNSTFSRHKHRSRLSRYPEFEQTWMVAPDYQLASLDAKAYGTDMDITCQDVTTQFIVQWAWGKIDSPRMSSPNYKPLDSPKELIQIDVYNSRLGINARIVHQTDEDIKVTPLLEENKRQGDANQYIIITDLHSDRSGPATVLQCAFAGKDFLTDIMMHSGIVEIKDKRTFPYNLDHRELVATRRAVARVLESAISPLSQALIAMKKAQMESTKKTKNIMLRKYMIQDMLTDLAQAYWSLMRQQIETSIGTSVLNQVPGGLNGYANSRLGGTYTRLGGSDWGLIMPALLLSLPIIALVRLILSMIFDVRAENESGASYWRPLLQDDEDDVEYMDAPPPMPPPKDDEDEAPPPYTVRMDDLETRETSVAEDMV